MIRQQYQRVAEQVAQAAVKAGRDPSEVQLMAVSKTKPVELILEAMAGGAVLFGENRVQELSEKRPQFSTPQMQAFAGAPGFTPKASVEFHMIGHLQTNKAAKAVQHADMIQSVDSVRIAREISRACVAQEKTMPVLLEVNIGREAAKFGFLPEQVDEALGEIARLPGVFVRGLMTIPPFLDDKTQIRQFFSQMHKLFIDIRGKKMDNISMDMLSMGMSDDFEEAIAEGSTLVRVGSAIFGSRY